jgi:hypothetical protein
VLEPLGLQKHGTSEFVIEEPSDYVQVFGETVRGA